MHVLHRASSSLRRTTRAFHSSCRVCDLVGPPDPITHMRPIIYDDAPQLPSAPSRLRHPYSLEEFNPRLAGPFELQWKLQRQQLDEFHQAFWLDVSSVMLFFAICKLMSCRATPVSKPQKLPYLIVCLPLRPHWTKKMHCQSFTSSGSWRRRLEPKIILRNGGNVTLTSSNWALACNSTNSVAVYLAWWRSRTVYSSDTLTNDVFLYIRYTTQLSRMSSQLAHMMHLQFSYAVIHVV